MYITLKNINNLPIENRTFFKEGFITNLNDYR